MLDAWMELHDFLWTSSWATTAEAIPSAFVCLKYANKDFRTGVTLAGNFGRDADTIGADRYCRDAMASVDFAGEVMAGGI